MTIDQEKKLKKEASALEDKARVLRRKAHELADARKEAADAKLANLRAEKAAKDKLQAEKLNKEKKLSKQSIKKKEAIPSTVKRLVWNTHIGESIGKSKCKCCKVTEITQLSFHCGHIISELHGGEAVVNNLKPICQNCNSSMGSCNMVEFIKKHGI